MTRTQLLAGAVMLAAATLAVMHLRTDPAASGNSAAAAAGSGTAIATPPAQRTAVAAPPPVASAAALSSRPIAAVTPSADAVALSFLAPRPSVKRGAAIDVLASIDTLRPVAKMALTVAFDPVLLRLRTDEEMDFSNDEQVVVRPRFRVETLRDGMVSLTSDMAPITGKSLLGILQFEAANAGSGSIDITSIRFVDDKGAGIAFSVATTRLPVVVD